ncbi:electron transfer flavoprotein subunit alpha/FixB family protein [Sporomusa sp. KB1]|jgi:electron transfer flavoprotein alpha subunit|uniref:electron transfer flavoprotein subunit alpha/FixB family protein n=1 Tax=Sporomusa sp. KB1 TaxID=943346 RepID=UPI0011AA6F89|nr:electron transfer flavoprotein subunit alpha/FixB family protein [Sporomusa sp. KB1]TWH45517.1 electron transfer flavoprotein alpha subunit apoprotein [Sporomusa sp. KB1]
MSQNVYVFAEQRDGCIQKVTLELIGKGKELANVLNQKVVAILLGKDSKSLAQILIEYGADSVRYLDHPVLAEYTTEPYTKAICEVVKQDKPEIVLYGATAIGRDLAPRVSARVHTGLTADCTKLEIDDTSQNLYMTRPAFGGNIMATIACEKHRPQMATVRPGVMQAIDRDSARVGLISEIEMDLSEADMNVKILEVVKEEKKKIDICEAKILVAGGRGVGNAENFKILNELAEVIGGETAASRSPVDEGWISHDKQVGQTGKTVRPDLYIACGISGAIQHVAGMESAEYIISINKNTTAPIFDVSDMGIIGDLNVIIPKLTAKLKKRKEQMGVNACQI